MERAVVKALRYLAVVCIATLAAWSLYTFTWRPLQCNALVQALSAPSYAANKTRTFRDIDQARLYLDQLQPCMSFACRNVPLLFVAAVNQRTTGRNEVALALYQEALRYDRRPEIYGNIGDAYYVLGDRNAAYQNYLTAASFHPQFLRVIDDGELRTRVANAVTARYPEFAQYVRYMQRDRYTARP
jgi:tetratricopeptide (TPR) repeat protein